MALRKRIYLHRRFRKARLHEGQLGPRIIEPIDRNALVGTERECAVFLAANALTFLDVAGLLPGDRDSKHRAHAAFRDLGLGDECGGDFFGSLGHGDLRMSCTTLLFQHEHITIHYLLCQYRGTVRSLQ